MKLEIERVTVKRAKELLENNSSNRNLRERTVEQYARDMEMGNWNDTGNPIRINCSDNLLLDGQHRLHAIIRSGKPQRMVIASGVPTQTMLNIDTGVRRTFSDNLKILGYRNVNNLAAAIRWGVTYEHPDRDLYNYKHAATNAELSDWFTKNPSIENAVNHVCGMQHGKLRGVVLPTIMLRYYCQRADFEQFFHPFVTSVGLTDGSPQLALRRYVDNAALGASPKAPKVMHGVTIKAWNAFMEGREVELLSFKAGGHGAEQFPTIITGS